MSESGILPAVQSMLSPVRRWGTKWSLWPVHFVTSCCGVEFAHAASPGYDAERWGFLNFGICRQTNVIVVEGTITKKMAKALVYTYGQMPDPKYVLLMGACGLKGGLFWNAYSIVDPADYVPIDFMVPGCPPTPESLIRSIRLLQEKIQTETSRSSVQHTPANMRSILHVRPIGEGESVPKPKLAPRSPKKVARDPDIKTNMPKRVDWPLGAEIAENIERDLGGIVQSVTITGQNRLCVIVPHERLEEAAVTLSRNFDHVKAVNGIDVPHEKSFIVEYALASYGNQALMPIIVMLTTETTYEHARVSSLAHIWPSADYFEREIYDYFGIWFEGNPAMGRKFLVPEDAQEFPLRKDYKLPQEAHVIKRDEQRKKVQSSLGFERMMRAGGSIGEKDR